VYACMRMRMDGQSVRYDIGFKPIHDGQHQTKYPPSPPPPAPPPVTDDESVRARPRLPVAIGKAPRSSTSCRSNSGGSPLPWPVLNGSMGVSIDRSID